MVKAGRGKPTAGSYSPEFRRWLEKFSVDCLRAESDIGADLEKLWRDLLLAVDDPNECRCEGIPEVSWIHRHHREANRAAHEALMRCPKVVLNLRVLAARRRSVRGVADSRLKQFEGIVNHFLQKNSDWI